MKLRSSPARPLPVAVLVALLLSACGGGDAPTPSASEITHPVFYGGPGAPVASVGKDGDYFVDDLTGALYGPKAAGAWPAAALSLVGPPGADGAVGPAGPAGSAGATGATGATGPSGADGADGADGAPGATGPAGAAGAPGPAGATGATGPASYETGWELASGNAQAAGTWSLATSNGGVLRTSGKYVQLLPQNCGTGTFRAATLGVPAADQTHSFTLFRAPGPQPANDDLVATAFSCTISSTARSCTTSGAAGFNAGDALELVWTNSATVGSQATPGAIAIAFSCN